MRINASTHLEHLVTASRAHEGNWAAGIDVHDAVVFLFCDVLSGCPKETTPAVGDDDVNFAERPSWPLPLRR